MFTTILNKIKPLILRLNPQVTEKSSKKHKMDFSSNELWLRAGFTLFVVLIYRFGSYIPVPGLNADVLKDIVNQSAGGVMSMLNLFSGGSIERATIFMMSLSPYITASMIIQLYTTMSPTLQALKKDGESGQKTRNQYTRYIALVLTVIQSYGVAWMLERQKSDILNMPAVAMPGFFFKFSTVITLTAGTFFLIWISEQITDRGIGQGSSIIIYTSIVASIPSSINKISMYLRANLLSNYILFLDIGLILGLMLVAAFFDQAYRAVKVVAIQSQRHLMHNSIPNEIPVKLNVGGVMAPMIASGLLSLPKTLSVIMPSMSRFILTDTFFAIAFGLLIFSLAFVTAPLTLDPEETAQDLQHNMRMIEGVRMGQDTVSFLEYLLNRLASISGLYLVIICLLPEIIIKLSGLQILFGGTSILIIVGVTNEIMTQIASLSIGQEYQKLMHEMRKQR